MRVSVRSLQGTTKCYNGPKRLPATTECCDPLDVPTSCIADGQVNTTMYPEFIPYINQTKLNPSCKLPPPAAPGPASGSSPPSPSMPTAPSSPSPKASLGPMAGASAVAWLLALASVLLPAVV